MTNTKIAGIGTAAVAKATGRTWDDWFAVLDAAGARQKDHPSIAAWLVRRYPQLGGWWAQMITVGYEQARGLRAPYQQAGGYSVSISKTVRAALGDLYRAWADARRRQRWLADAPLMVRKTTPGKSVRARWTADDTIVNVNFYAKGPGKSQIVVQHEKLPSATAVRRVKSDWRARLERLQTLLEKPRSE